MKARIRTPRGIEDVALLSTNYDDAMHEVMEMIEDGTVKDDEYVVCIIED